MPWSGNTNRRSWESGTDTEGAGVLPGWGVWDPGVNTSTPGATADDMIFEVDLSLADFNGFTIPAVGGPYDVYWGDGDSDLGVSGPISHTYASEDVYDVRISSTAVFQPFKFDNLGTREKLSKIHQWGAIKWNSLNGAFFGCTFMDVDAIDSPDFSRVVDGEFGFTNNFALSKDMGAYNYPLLEVATWMFAGTPNMKTWKHTNGTMESLRIADQMFFQVASGQGPADFRLVHNSGNLESMREMFFKCDLGGMPGDVLVAWNTSNVTDVAGLAVECRFRNFGPGFSWVSAVDAEGMIFGMGLLNFDGSILDPGFTLPAATNCLETASRCANIKVRHDLNLRAMTIGTKFFEDVARPFGDDAIYSDITLETIRDFNPNNGVTFWLGAFQYICGTAYDTLIAAPRLWVIEVGDRRCILTLDGNDLEHEGNTAIYEEVI